MFNYDDWKLRSDRDDSPQPERNWYCEKCEHYSEDQGCCPCCMTQEDIAWEKGTRRFEREHDEGKR